MPTRRPTKTSAWRPSSARATARHVAARKSNAPRARSWGPAALRRPAGLARRQQAPGNPMIHYIVRRLGYSMISLLLLSLTIFLFVRLTGDPATLLVEPGASQADLEAVRQRLGLDQPIWVQYWQFMLSLLHGDFGDSF